MPITLTESQKQIIINACYTAAEKYRECAKTMRDFHQPVQLAEQFDKQVADVKTIIEMME